MGTFLSAEWSQERKEVTDYRTRGEMVKELQSNAATAHR
jgi:hypothetical protein